ncbi:hypothetical protein WJ83_25885 [Burkholderia ubonensis]|nr:hypothetical protein WJ83_25885 [Burkholderia ubonensis]
MSTVRSYGFAYIDVRFIKDDPQTWIILLHSGFKSSLNFLSRFSLPIMCFPLRIIVHDHSVLLRRLF